MYKADDEEEYPEGTLAREKADLSEALVVCLNEVLKCIPPVIMSTMAMAGEWLDLITRQSYRLCPWYLRWMPFWAYRQLWWLWIWSLRR